MFEFTCPYTKMRLQTGCGAESCSFYTKSIPSKCIWEHVSNRSGNLTSEELAHLIGVNKRIILKILKEAKVKIATRILKNSPIAHKILGKHIPNYCSECGKAYNLIKTNNGYSCKGKHLSPKKIALYSKAFSSFPLPISSILYVLPKVFSDLSGIRACLNLKTNIDVRKLYYDILGIPMSKLVPRAKLGGPLPLKRLKKRYGKNIF